MAGIIIESGKQVMRLDSGDLINDKTYSHREVEMFGLNGGFGSTVQGPFNEVHTFHRKGGLFPILRLTNNRVVIPE